MIIYKTTNLITGKIYIGQHECSQKCNKNCRYFGSGTYIVNALKKYNRKNFTRETLEVIEDLTKTAERETYWIEKFDATNSDIGYNIAKNGNSVTAGWKHSSKSKEQMHESQLKRYEDGEIPYWKGKERSPETLAIMKENGWQKGEEPWNKGVPLTEEQKLKIGEATREALSDPLIREKISKSKSGENHPNFGKHLSPLTIEKIRQSNIATKAKYNPNFGRKHSPETIEKIRQSNIATKAKKKLAN